MPQFHGIIAPHPFGIIPHNTNKEIIKEYEPLINNYLQLAQKVGEWRPDLIVIISPRGTCHLEGPAINIPPNNTYTANLSEINQANLEFEFDKATSHSLIKTTTENNYQLIQTENEHLDAGCIIPLFYLNKHLNQQPELIYLSMSLTSPQNHFQLGSQLAQILETGNKKVLFIASATLSAKLSKDSPGGFNSRAKTFDKELRQDLEQSNYESITLYDSFELDEVAEAAVRPISTLLGFLQANPHQLQEHCYLTPEGIGELLASTFDLTS